MALQEGRSKGDEQQGLSAAVVTAVEEQSTRVERPQATALPPLLLPRSSVLRGASAAAPHLLNPTPFVRTSAIRFICCAARTLAPVDCFAFLLPIIRPTLARKPAQICAPSSLSFSLKPPIVDAESFREWQRSTHWEGRRGGARAGGVRRKTGGLGALNPKPSGPARSALRNGRERLPEGLLAGHGRPAEPARAVTTATGSMGRLHHSEVTPREGAVPSAAASVERAAVVPALTPSPLDRSRQTGRTTAPPAAASLSSSALTLARPHSPYRLAGVTVPPPPGRPQGSGNNTVGGARTAGESVAASPWRSDRLPAAAGGASIAAAAATAATAATPPSAGVVPMNTPTGFVNPNTASSPLASSYYISLVSTHGPLSVHSPSLTHSSHAVSSSLFLPLRRSPKLSWQRATR